MEMTDSGYVEFLQIHRIRVCGLPKRGGLPSWGGGRGLTLPVVKCYMEPQAWIDSLERHTKWKIVG